MRQPHRWSLGGISARTPRLLRLLGGHLAYGVLIGMAFATVLISNKQLGLLDLMIRTEQPVLAVVMLFFVNALTFGSLSMGIGVMTLPLERPDDFDEDPPPPDRPDR